MPGDGIEVWTKNEPHVGCGISKPSRAGEVISVMIKGDIEKNDVVYKTYDKALMDSMKKTYEKDTRKTDIYGKLTVKRGKPMELKLWLKEGVSIVVSGAEPAEAENRPATKDSLEKQIGKMGSTPFRLEKLDVILDGGLFADIKSLNDLRRSACELLEEKITSKNKHGEPEFVAFPETSVSGIKKNKRLNVKVRNMEQFNAACREGVNTIYFEMSDELGDNLEKIIEKAHSMEIEIFAAFPRIYRKKGRENICASYFKTVKQYA